MQSPGYLHFLLLVVVRELCLASTMGHLWVHAPCLLHLCVEVFLPALFEPGNIHLVFLLNPVLVQEAAVSVRQPSMHVLLFHWSRLHSVHLFLDLLLILHPRNLGVLVNLFLRAIIMEV